MKRIDLNTGVIPLSEFRANATRCVTQVRETRRPMVITQHGKSASVLMDVGEYEKLMDRLELLQDVETAERQLDEGQGVAHKADGPAKRGGTPAKTRSRKGKA